MEKPGEMVSNSSWATAVLDALHGYQQHGFLCDYTLVANDGSTVAVHMCVLAAASPRLYEYIYKDNDASSNKVKTLKCSPQELTALINYAYTGVLDVQNCNNDDVCDVMSLLGLPLSALADDDNDDDDPASDAAPFNDDCIDTVCAETITVEQPQDTKEPCRDVFIDKTGTIQCEVSDALDEKPEVFIFRNSLHLEDEKSSTGVCDVLSGVDAKSVEIKRDDDRITGNEMSVGSMDIPCGECFKEVGIGETEEAKHDIRSKGVCPLGPPNTVKKECATSGPPNALEREGATLGPPDTLERKGASVTCRSCNGSFASWSALAVHKKVCASGVASGTRKNTKRKKKRSVNIKKSSLECPRCGNFFRSRDTLSMHIKTVHDGIRPFGCEVCGKAFTQKAKLLQHHRVHTGEKPFECEHCSKKFGWERCYKKHVMECRGHPTLKRAKRKQKNIPSVRECHVCDICGKVLSSKGGLKSHKLYVHAEIKKFCCEICGKGFARKSGLLVHTAHHTGEKAFQCSHCDKSFASRSSHWKHEQSCRDLLETLTAEGQAYACSQCQISFTCKREYIVHDRRIHSGLPPSICTLCGKPCINEEALRYHVSHVHCERRFSCTKCGKKYKTKGHLKEHCDNVHNIKQKNFLCRICGKAYFTIFSLKMHELTHTKRGKSFTCGTCDKSFTSKASLISHGRFHGHYNAHDRCFHCTTCDKSFFKQWILTLHMKTVHSGRQFSCTKCDKKYKTKGHLKEHCDSVHNKQRNFLCRVCGKPFFRSQDLKVHERIHTVREKPFSCDTCEKSFTSKACLISHERFHSSERPYKCSYCEKTFILKQSCQIHERKHTGERPYKCNFCEKGFASQSTLSIHKRSHTGERPYHCSMCPVTYAYSGKLRIHYKNKHNVDLPVHKNDSKDKT